MLQCGLTSAFDAGSRDSRTYWARTRPDLALGSGVKEERQLKPLVSYSDQPDLIGETWMIHEDAKDVHGTHSIVPRQPRPTRLVMRPEALIKAHDPLE